jgi:hypothetical protein
VNRLEALNDITKVSNRSNVTSENKEELVFNSAILALAKNIRVVTQIDRRIMVLEIESNSESVEVATVDGY